MADCCDFDEHPSETLRVGKKFRLKDCDPDSTPGYPGEKADGEALLAELDGKLTTCRSSSSPSPGSAAPSAILLVLQAMDTAGKGGIVNHVMGTDESAGCPAEVLQGAHP